MFALCLCRDLCAYVTTVRPMASVCDSLTLCCVCLPTRRRGFPREYPSVVFWVLGYRKKAGGGPDFQKQKAGGGPIFKNKKQVAV